MRGVTLDREKRFAKNLPDKRLLSKLYKNLFRVRKPVTWFLKRLENLDRHATQGKVHRANEHVRRHSAPVLGEMQPDNIEPPHTWEDGGNPRQWRQVLVSVCSNRSCNPWVGMRDSPGRQFGFFQNWRHTFTIWTSSGARWYLPKYLETSVETETCTGMFIVALFRIAKTQQLRYLLDDVLDKQTGLTRQCSITRL